MNQRIGIFGGTFDPIHAGHILVAKEAQQQYKLDRIIFVPAGDPWQKNNVVAGKMYRLAMTRLAVDNHGGEVSPVEIVRNSPTYTVETVRHFKNTFPHDELFLIIGSDVDTSTWVGWSDISRLSPPIQMKRWFALSSTLIRRRIAMGLPVVPLIDREVAYYIDNNGLYRAPISPTQTATTTDEKSTDATGTTATVLGSDRSTGPEEIQQRETTRTIEPLTSEEIALIRESLRTGHYPLENR